MMNLVKINNESAEAVERERERATLYKQKIVKDNTKGITLIALVISIIVLLILAGIAISMLNGENGILKQVANAKESTEDSKEQERIKIAVTSAQTETKYNMTEESLKRAFENEFGEGKTNSKLWDDGTITILIKDTNKEYNIDKNGNITISITEPVNDTEGLNGEGTQEKPYKIESIEDLVYLSEQVNNGNSYSGKYITLERDLNFKSLNSYIEPTKIVDEENNIDLITSMTSGEGFIPIGIGNTSSTKFKGIFDGKNKKIYNLYEEREKGSGLFGINLGTIQNLRLENITLTGSGNIGGIVALSDSSSNIINCSVEGNTNIIANVTYDSNGKAVSNNIGVVVGYTFRAIIEKCYSKGTMNINGGGNVGGIVGYSRYGEIRRCYNIMDISATGRVGGIAGCANEPQVEECYHIGDISSGKGTGMVGGIAADVTNNPIIENCYNIGDMEGRIAGGIAGMGTADCFNCYSIGKITRSYEGGTIRGMNYGGHIVHCFGRRGDFGNLPEGELTEKQIIACLSQYNARGVYGHGDKAQIGYKCNALYDEEFKTQEFVDELNILIEAGISGDTEGEITETSQNIWLRDVNNINNGYPIFAWQQ